MNRTSPEPTVTSRTALQVKVQNDFKGFPSERKCSVVSEASIAATGVVELTTVAFRETHRVIHAVVNNVGNGGT